MARERKGGLAYDAVPDLVRSGAPAHPAESRQVRSGAPAHPAESRQVRSGAPEHQEDGPQVQSGASAHRKDRSKVQSGASAHQEDRPQVPPRPAASRSSSRPPKSKRKAKAANLEYDPEPFEGARAAAGPSPAAQDTLCARGLMGPARKVEQAPTPAVTASRGAASKVKTGKPRVAAETASKKERAVQSSRTQKRSQARPAAKGPQRKQSAPPRKTTTRKSQAKRIARTVRLAPNVEAKLQQIADTFGVDLNSAVAIAITHGFKALGDAGLVPEFDVVPSADSRR